MTARALARRVRDALRGETAASYFDPRSRHDLARLLGPHGVAAPAARPADGSSVDRVRQVYELRPDVRDVFPLGLTPAGRGEYADWLFRYGRGEYGLTDDEITGYLVALADDPACGLADTYLLTPAWQRAVPHGLTPAGWGDLKRWVADEYPGRTGRWLGRARRPTRFDRWAAAPGRAVNLVGHFKYECGLQEELAQYAAALEGAGYAVFRRDVPVSYPRDWRDGGRFTDPEAGSISLVKMGAADPLPDVYRRAGLHPRPGVYRVACWSWELETFPPAAAEHGGLADEVWTPSEFCARAARAALPGVPVRAMLPAVVAPAPEPRPRAALGLPDGFLFLFAFDMASGFERKNPLGLIRAFRRAFRLDEPVRLALKVSRGETRPAAFAALRSAAAEAGVKLIDRVMPRDEVCALLAACDAYVSLHRAEGFGLTLAEAMLLGKPAVGTAYSGNLDFMTPENSYLVRYARGAVPPGAAPYPAGAAWADPDEGHAAELLRRVVDRPAEARGIAARGQAEAAALLSPAAAARRLCDRLGEIAGR